MGLKLSVILAVMLSAGVSAQVTGLSAPQVSHVIVDSGTITATVGSADVSDRAGRLVGVVSFASAQPVTFSNSTIAVTNAGTFAVQATLGGLGQNTAANSLSVVQASNALPSPDRAATSTITALFGSATVLSQGAGTVTIALGGTWVGTLSFFGLDGAGQLFALFGVNIITGLSEAVATANGAWIIPSAGWSSIGAIATAWTSGTATTAMIAGPGSNVVSLARSLPTGANIIGGLLSNVAPGTTAPTNIEVIGGKTGDLTPQYQPVPLVAGGLAVPVAVIAQPRGLPLQPCNAIRRTNCAPKGF